MRSRESRDRWNAKVGKQFLHDYHVQYRNKNRERFRERARRWKKANRPWMKLTAKLWKKEYDRKRYLADKPKAVERSIRRRLTQLNQALNPEQVYKFRKKLQKAGTFICYYCQRRFAYKHLNIEHVIAIARGGFHSLANVAASCRSCNQSKKAKTFDEWTPHGGQKLLSL